MRKKDENLSYGGFNMYVLAAELVERVVLLGAPISINSENWRDVRKVIRLFLTLPKHMSHP